MRDRVLWLGCLVYVALFTWLGSVKFAAHRNLVDFGIFAQTVAGAFGCFCNPVEGNHWAFHFSPILYPVALVVALVRSPLTLVALQAIAGALVAPPVYAMVRPKSGVPLARLAALVVWLYPPLAGLIFGDFHENGFAPAGVAWTLYAFDAGLLAWAFFAALATLLVKEDQAVFLAIGGALGAWRFWGTKRARAAAAITVVSVLVLVLFFGYIQPHVAMGATGSWQPWRFYAWSVPAAAALAAGIAARVGFLLLVFVPLLFLPFRSSIIWLAVAPLGEVLLSRMPTTFTLGTHYAGAWLGYVLTAFAFGLRELEPRRARTAVLVCIGLCMLEFAVADPLHPALNLHWPQPRDVALDRFLQTLPSNAGVATQEEAYTHLALFDRTARPFPETASQPVDACYLLIDLDFPDSPRLQEYGGAVQQLVREGVYLPTAQSGGIVLYRRAKACR